MESVTQNVDFSDWSHVGGDTYEEQAVVAKAKGVVFGRPVVAKPENFEQVMELVDAGQMKAVEAMRQLGVRKTTFYKLRRAYWINH